MPKPYIQPVPPGKQAPKTLTLFSFQSGLNNVHSQTLVDNTSATNVLNMVYMEDGLIQKRYGTNPYNAHSYNKPIKFFDTFETKDDGIKTIVATDTEIYDGTTVITTVKGQVSGVTFNDKYMFVDGTALYTYEKVDGRWTCYKIVSPTNTEDALKEDAKKTSKTIVVNTPSKFQAGYYIQIGRDNRTKDPLDDTPPPQVCRVLKVEGNTLTLGSEVDRELLTTTTNNSSTNDDDNETKSETSNQNDFSKTVTKYTSGTPTDKDNTVETTIDSKRNSGTGKTVTHTIQTGVTITKTTTKNDEDEKIYEYDRLDYDYKAGTPIIIFGNINKYAPIGEVKTSGSNKYYEPCAFELDDAYKGVNLLPTKPNRICLHKNRIILSGDSEGNTTLYIGHTNNPYYFPVGLGLSVPNTGDSINGLISYHDALVVARKTDMHVVYGSSNKPEHQDLFKLMQINTHTGCASGNTMKLVHNFMFFLGSDGIIYRMHTTQTDMRLLATSVASQTLDLFKEPLNMTYEQFGNASAVFCDDHYYLTIGDKVLVYSYRFQAWTVFDRLDAAYLGLIGEELIWAKGQRLFHFDKGKFQDEGVEYNCLWESKLFDLDLPVNYKYFKYISLVFNTFEEYDSVARLLFEIDYEDVKLDYTFKNAISRWGKAKWGIDRFATRNITKSLPVYVGRRGRLVKVKIHNGHYVSYNVQNTSDLDTLTPKIDDVAYVRSTKRHMKYVYNTSTTVINWEPIDNEEINNTIRLHNIEIEYSVRGRR